MGGHDESISTAADPFLNLAAPGPADMDIEDIQRKCRWELQADKTFCRVAAM